jgi:hypothetical protein
VNIFEGFARVLLGHLPKIVACRALKAKALSDRQACLHRSRVLVCNLHRL